MRPSEATALLTVAASLDNRTIGEAAARAWAETIEPTVTLVDATRIVYEHYASTREWIMPADINRRSREIRDARLRDMKTPEPPEALEGVPARELGWQRSYRRLVADGLTEAQADVQACAEHGVDRPAVEASPRPLTAILGTHKVGCPCGCLTRPIRTEERRP